MTLSQDPLILRVPPQSVQEFTCIKLASLINYDTSKLKHSVNYRKLHLVQISEEEKDNTILQPVSSFSTNSYCSIAQLSPYILHYLILYIPLQELLSTLKLVCSSFCQIVRELRDEVLSNKHIVGTSLFDCSYYYFR